MTASQLCEMLGGELEGDPDVEVSQPSKIEEAEAGSLTFLANPKYESFVYETGASVLLVEKSFVPTKPISATLIKVENVYQSLGVLLEAFKDGMSIDSGLSELAFVHESAQLGDDVTVGPFAYIGRDAHVASGTTIYPHVFVGQGVRIGQRSTVYPGVKIYHGCVVGADCVVHANSVIGSDGFGFARAENGVFDKIAQVGNVVLEDGVEIGANTVIDRATMGSTVLAKGVKLDNLIQVAHNVEIGENTAIAAQAGIAGSTKIGRNVLVGGQAGFVGHIQVADNVQIQAQSGVATSVENAGEKLYGSPALSYMDYLKSYAVFRRLPGLEQRLHELEKSLKALDHEPDS